MMSNLFTLLIFLICLLLILSVLGWLADWLEQFIPDEDDKLFDYDSSAVPVNQELWAFCPNHRVNHKGRSCLECVLDLE